MSTKHGTIKFTDLLPGCLLLTVWPCLVHADRIRTGLENESWYPAFPYADDYFMQDGEYKWDATKLGEAHRTCQEKCEKLMERSARLVIVANTSVRGKDFEPYIDLAERYGYQVFSVIVENRHGNDNVHNVPDDVVDSMKRKFQINL